jgi:nitroimidazol reductase NimA-like FMN-containing flavoprotein (pyridoxamine 5'-phosphate oxidase superfamily)
MLETRVEVLSREQCLSLLGKVPVGRIGITVGALPVILPVNFAMLEDSVIFHTIPGTKLSAATENNVVAFEVDHYEADGRSSWSVLVQGVASEVTEPLALQFSLSALGAPWGVGEVANRVVKIDVDLVTGRRFGVTGK